MIQRVNLIESEPFRFTYEQIAKGMGIWLGFLVLLYAFPTILKQYYTRQERTLSGEIEALKVRRDELLKTTQVTMTEGPLLEIKGIFDSTPQWSKFLNDLIIRMPSNVWFNSLKTSGGKDGTIVFYGIARDTLDLADFLSRLNQSPFIKDAVLSTSKKEKISPEKMGGIKLSGDQKAYTFSIEGKLVVPVD